MIWELKLRIIGTTQTYDYKYVLCHIKKSPTLTPSIRSRHADNLKTRERKTNVDQNVNEERDENHQIRPVVDGISDDGYNYE